MAAESRILRNWPTSSQQLTQVVETLAGNAYTILPTDHLYDISSVILSQCDGGIDTGKLMPFLPTGELAAILTSTFTCLIDEDIDKIVLEGIASLALVATIFTWFMPSQTIIVRDQRVIYGETPARLVIKIRENPKGSQTTDSTWTLRQWQKDSAIENLISIKEDFGPKLPRLFYTRRSCKHKLQSSHKLHALGIKVVGQIAGALFCRLIERGKVCLDMPDGKIKSMPLLSVATDWFCQEYAGIMRFYGWSRDELAGQGKIYEVLQEWQIEPDDMPNGLAARLRKWVDQNWTREEITYGNGIDDRLFTEIQQILEDSLLYISWHESSDSCPPTLMGRRDTFTRENRGILKPLLQDPGISLQNLRNVILEMLFPDWNDFKGNELIIAQNGLVVWPSIIREPSVERRIALALTCTPGYIKRGRDRFAMVIEEPGLVPMIFRGVETLGPACPFEQNSFVGLTPRSGLLETEMVVRSNVRGTILYVSSDILFRGPNPGWDELAISRKLGVGTGVADRNFEWLSVIHGILAAIHVDSRETMTAIGEENLAQRIWLESNRPDNELPQWISADSTWKPTDEGRYIVQTCGDTMLSLYQLSQPMQNFVVCHNASLIKAVATAYQHNDHGWRIIT